MSDTKRTVADLIAELTKAVKVQPELARFTVVLSRDAEGNGYSEWSGNWWPGHVNGERRYNLEFMDAEDWAEMQDLEEAEDREDYPGDNCIGLWPI